MQLHPTQTLRHSDTQEVNSVVFVPVKRFLHDHRRSAMIAMALCAMVVMTAHAQYDVTTQAVKPITTAGLDPQYVAASNIGQYVVGGNFSDMFLVGSSATSVANTPGISTDGNTAVATNHDMYTAIVRVGISGDGHSTYIKCRFWDNRNATSNDGGLSMLSSTILGTSLQPEFIAGTTTDVGLGLIQRVEANMDSKNLYIAFQTGSGNLGYCVVKLSDQSTVAGPAAMTDGTLPALGSIPTVGCYRWSPNVCHIGFAEPGRTTQCDFQINATTLATSVTTLPAPTGELVLWVRAVCFDHVSGAGATSYYLGCIDGVTHGCPGKLYYYDGTTLTLVSANLAFSPGISNPLPDPAVGDPYHLWGGTTQSVFCVYKETDCNTPETQTIKICWKAGGGANTQTIWAGTPGIASAFHFVASNQMGTFSIFDNGGATRLWRNFQKFDEDIQENTLATGLCQADGATMPTMDIVLHPADTLRFWQAAPRSTEKFLFNRSHLTIHAGWPWSNSSFSSGQTRAHIMMSGGAIIDFGSSNNQDEIIAEGRGSWEYDGATLNNMNADIFAAQGNMGTTDATAANMGLIFMNAACTIDNGSSLQSTKGQIQWLANSGVHYPYVFSVNGNNSFITWDHSTVYLGSTDGTQGGSLSMSGALGEDNIVFNNDGSATGQFMEATHCWIATQFQDNILSDLYEGARAFGDPAPDGMGYNPNGWRSNIILYAPDHVTFSNNDVVFAFLGVMNPVNAVKYNNNTVCSIQQGLWFDQTDYNPSSTDIEIKNNSFEENWPFGGSATATTGLAAAIDVQVTGFEHLLTVDDVLVQSNLLRGGVGSTGLWIPLIDETLEGWTGILLDNGTTGAVTDNTVLFHTVGIHTQSLDHSLPFLCNNDIEWCSCNILGSGIEQNGTGDGHGYTKNNTVFYMSTGFFSAGDDKSRLLGNTFQYNNNAVKITGPAKTEFRGDHYGGNNNPGNNFIENSVGTEVWLLPSTSGAVPLPLFGAKDGTPTGDYSNWGQNYINSTAGSPWVSMQWLGTGNLDLTQGGTNGNTALTANIWNHAPGTGSLSLPVTSDPNVLHITFENQGNSTGTPGSYSCGGFTPRKGQEQPQGAIDDWYPDSLKLYYHALNHQKAGNPVECQKGLDTMRMYVQQHPFAVHNETDDAITQTGDFVVLLPDDKNHIPWKLEYNWLLLAQQWNPDTDYQRAIWYGLGNTTKFDLNLQANLWYNIMLRYHDTAGCWQVISGIRNGQANTRPRPDTTPWKILTFPIDTVPIPSGANVVRSLIAGTSSSLSLSPNPAASTLMIDFTLSHGGQTSITIYDETGSEIKQIVNGPRAGGDNEVVVALKDIPNGHYFVRLSSGQDVITKELIVQH